MPKPPKLYETVLSWVTCGYFPEKALLGRRQKRLRLVWQLQKHEQHQLKLCRTSFVPASPLQYACSCKSGQSLASRHGSSLKAVSQRHTLMRLAFNV